MIELSIGGLARALRQLAHKFAEHIPYPVTRFFVRSLDTSIKQNSADCVQSTRCGSMCTGKNGSAEAIAERE